MDSKYLYWVVGRRKISAFMQIAILLFQLINPITSIIITISSAAKPEY
jgi:hypothetical protein